MSRVAKSPVKLPAGVELNVAEQQLEVKGPKGSLQCVLNEKVSVTVETGVAMIKPVDELPTSWAQAGTARAIVNNMVLGVSGGFEKKLQLVGVGYRAQAKGGMLSLTLGFSHPVEYKMPEGIEAETPSQTEVVIKGIDKQLVGQVAANVRAFRPPEPYKGKGVRYADEHIKRKEAKKK